MNNLQASRSYPLHLTISALFITLVVVLGVILSWQNYSKTSEIILSSADKMYDQVTQELLLDIKATYRPVGNTLGLLALTPLVDAMTLPDRLRSVPLLSEALRSESAVTGIQAGYANGDYFIVRLLADASLRKRFEAPANAAFMADHVDTDTNGGRRMTRIYFDANLHEIVRKAAVKTEYDPRLRGWYKLAVERSGLVLTEPYLFYFMKRAGLTLAREVGDSGVVVASDVTLERLSETIRRYQVTPGTEIVMFSKDGKALAYPDTEKLLQKAKGENLDMTRLTGLGSPVLTFLAADLQPSARSLSFEFDGRSWEGAIRKISRDGITDIFVLMVSPLDELLAEAIAIRTQSFLIMVLIILLTIPIVWFAAQRIAGPLRKLSLVARQINKFDFNSSTQAQSFVTEVDDLAQIMEMMKKTISQFLGLINSLASEQNFDALLDRISRETMLISQADGVLVYLLDDDEHFLDASTLYDRNRGKLPVASLPRIPMDSGEGLAAALGRQGSSVLKLSVAQAGELDSLPQQFDETALTLIALPLRNRQEELIGVLSLLYRVDGDTADAAQQSGHIAFIEALSGFAAVSIESRQLMMMQQALLDAFIKLIAGAIDAKSPYTGGHCTRVPALTRMLAQAACASSAAPFSEFDLDEKQWEAVDIASWLHDCGKVTTPEYVVDKATKLETIYDRIHEIRTRFEVLKRDAQIRYHEQLAAGVDPQALKNELEESLQQLDDDFAFVAGCNQGGEFMEPEKQARLQQIAMTTWMRTLDDRLGVSWEELQRLQRSDVRPLPAEERLLDDKQEHLIERAPVDHMPEDNPWGFRMDVPEYKYNRGELYNLGVSRGTLTNEERYKINDHIMQTIMMLEKLPYPRHLRDVPMIAGCHHETMDGKGYPKRLSRDDMPLTARMMAIADIFEALTASDRPYKKAKKLSEAIRIMGFMKKDRHIDPALFELFLTSGVYLDYGRQFLEPEQLDEVNIAEYLD
jgi:HD-GYP domain-containing protein (c-di-GMP phosphodiesterase class II)/HAMP domain-containing protein